MNSIFLSFRDKVILQGHGEGTCLVSQPLRRLTVLEPLDKVTCFLDYRDNLEMQFMEVSLYEISISGAMTILLRYLSAAQAVPINFGIASSTEQRRGCR